MKKNLLVVAALSFLIQPSYGQGHRERCEKDFLDIKQAFGRIDWTKRCASNYVVQLYNDLRLPQDVDDNEKVRRITYDWTHFYGKKRSRPEYPTFTVKEIGKGQWIAPTSGDPSCQQKVPANMKIYTTCVASCYHPDEPVMYDIGFVPIAEAMQESLNGIMVVSEESSLARIGLVSKSVHSYIKSRTEISHQLLHFTMESGGELKITKNHPLVNREGKMLEAQSFAVGSYILRADGAPDKVVAIEDLEYFGRVYNVQPDSGSLKGNIVVAGGYLSGSNWYQNGGFSYIGSRILRENIPANLLDEK